MNYSFLSFLFCIITILFSSCNSKQDGGLIMTVNGYLNGSAGQWLTHEHVLVDFAGADSISPDSYNRVEVVKKVLPYLRQAKLLGCNTFAECTPEYLGRDPLLLKMLADSTGLNILTNTGLYGAHENRYIPRDAFALSAEDLARIWTDEWTNGIKGTGIKPGFIKIAVMPDSLSDFHRKLVRAAALTHLSTGLTIASHTGPAIPAFQEIEILEKECVSPSAFIWVHAANEKNLSLLAKAAEKGAWISLDKLNDENVDEMFSIIRYMKSEGYLHKVLLSHDAGWYDPGKPGGGDFRGYSVLFEKLIPALRKDGFTENEIKLMTVTNPARAFGIRVRKTI